jgi:hypothetical protein
MNDVPNVPNLEETEEATILPDIETDLPTASPATTQKKPWDMSADELMKWLQEDLGIHTDFPQKMPSPSKWQEEMVYWTGTVTTGGSDSFFPLTKSKPTSPTPPKKKDTSSGSIVIGKRGR